MHGGGTQLRSSQLAGRPPRDAFGGANITEDSESSQLLLGGAGLLGIGMGVVETQQIREDDEEEADDDDEEQGNEPQEQYEEYAGEFELGMTRDTQAVEGGGPSQSTGQNTHGNSAAHNSSHNTAATVLVQASIRFPVQMMARAERERQHWPNVSRVAVPPALRPHPQAWPPPYASVRANHLQRSRI